METRKTSFKTDKAFLHHLFLKTHQAFLGEFSPYASFRDLISANRYNCLSGTALYALLFHHFGIDFTIVENNYHIFILANTSQGNVLIEATDPLNGFIDDPKIITRKIEKYRTQRVDSEDASKKFYHYKFSGSDTVSLTGMLGLLHYNRAVEAFNDQNLKLAITHLHQALLLHRSPKLEAFLELLFTSVTHNNSLDSQTRDQYLTRLQTLQMKKSMPITNLMILLIR
jgi:hypothetical protein